MQRYEISSDFSLFLPWFYDLQRPETWLRQGLSRQPLSGRASPPAEGAREPPLAVLPKERQSYGIKAGFCRSPQHKRAGAPIYKGARPNLWGRAMATSQNVPFSLFPSTFLPVCRLLSPFCKACSFFVGLRPLPPRAVLFPQETAFFCDAKG